MIYTQDPALLQDPIEQLSSRRKEPVENPTLCQRVNLFFSEMPWGCCDGNDIVPREPRGENFPSLPSFSSLGSLPSLPTMDVDCCEAIGACGEAIGDCGDLIEPCCELMSACCIN